MRKIQKCSKLFFLFQFLIAIVSLLISGCLSFNNSEKNLGMSAFSKRPIILDTVDKIQGNLELIGVIGLEPESDGMSRRWKFTYNNYTSGKAISSLDIIVKQNGQINILTNNPLSKPEILNWSLDSTSVYVLARNRLIEDKIISGRSKIKISYIYLMGDKLDNNGCEWVIGLILGYKILKEVIVRVDGYDGKIISLKS